jgi:hypothetical protein
MLEHGCVNGIGYCPNGNNGDCLCTVKGMTYDEALKAIKG